MASSLSLPFAHHAADALLVTLKEHVPFEQPAPRATAFLSHQMVQLRAAPQQLTGAGHLEALRGRLTCLQLGHRVKSHPSQRKAGSSPAWRKLTSSTRTYFGARIRIIVRP